LLVTSTVNADTSTGISAAEALELNPTAPRPPEETQPLVDGRQTHPLYNDQPMKLGLFGTNCSYGLIMSHAETTYRATWEHTLQVARTAEAIGFEALVPIARWRGFGGTTNFNGNCFETYAWAAGLAQATERIGIFATSHLPTMHPIVAAKAATTIDHISGGRFGLNLVMGWFSPEMEMFDGTQREHDERYTFGQEWLDLVLKLWSEEGSFDHHGDFFNCRGVESYPKPHQAPRPILINAGNSKAGVEFSARNVDVNFASLTTFEEMKAYTDTIRGKAREEHQRDIKTMTYGLVVCRDTEKEAKAAFQHVIDKGDWGAAENVMKIAGMQSQSFNEQIKQFQERFIAGWAGFPIVGNPEQVTEQFGQLKENGMEGMIMGMVDYNEEMKYFDAEVMPLLKQAGLRH
jgi:FMNH2-dependent dimethyl sulfone monooxygenase